jgi:UDP-2,3-diacylglucosamine hydrolase
MDVPQAHLLPVPAQVLQAPKHWQRVSFLSDVHLQASQAATLAAWEDAVRQCDADALFILGDLFEVWIGDDSALQTDSFEAHCLEVLRSCSAQRPVYFMHGNRDFLFGPTAAERSGVELLQDPTLLAWGQTRTLLSHGDALCVDDLPYQAFRAQVRHSEWQAKFLAQPLQARRDQAAAMRSRSEANKQTATYVDVDWPTAENWLSAAHAQLLVHGHTHQPAHEQHGQLARLVLSDWEAQSQPARLEMVDLRLSNDQASLHITRRSLV